ncbi:TetR/AcrR family transcriptional regulator [Nocardia vermiculata]|uniref:Helix-turn-helix transcriptional regulator n=1 Tax=Nocardia vermiculata TaxID=257274 RepID=A0A846XZS7_9NOCA|nr:TetR/AcrR family transcriptional regulator [Nocardia vermiculata]NKY50901.1 helix-turn-helix transcriptional regulator [Nocardia vermiculata]
MSRYGSTDPDRGNDEGDVAADADVAARIARRALQRRGEVYTEEVRRLLDAGLEVMRRCGTSSRPRVADIVAAAGLSNDAFYRHFASKDALVAALLEDGTHRLLSYLGHRMSKRCDPEGAVREWVDGVLSQGAGEVAATTRAVLWNAGGLALGLVTGPPEADVRLATLLHAPFTELGCAHPEVDAALAAHAVVGHLAELLWRQREPTADDVEHVTALCLRVARPAPSRS